MIEYRINAHFKIYFCFTLYSVSNCVYTFIWVLKITILTKKVLFKPKNWYRFDVVGCQLFKFFCLKIPSLKKTFMYYLGLVDNGLVKESYSYQIVQNRMKTWYNGESFIFVGFQWSLITC